jgi:hypothetical protein
MANWSTLHIFGFGDIQVITKEGGQTKKASDLTKLQSVIDMVWAQKPDENTNTKEYHAINIFNGLFADWQSKTKVDKGYRTKYDKLIAETIEALINEVLA